MKNEPRIPITFSLPAKEKFLLDYFDAKAKMDRISRSKLIRKAMLEYANKHGEGNPQKPLDFSEPTLSPVARIEAGVRFLRTKNKLSLKKIAAITGLSFRQVHKICKDIPGNAKKRSRKFFRLHQYQQKWQLFKRGISPENAFKF